MYSELCCHSYGRIFLPHPWSACLQIEDLRLEIGYEKPLERARAELRGFQVPVRAALRSFHLNSAERDELTVLMGTRAATQRLVASNGRLRLQATAILIREFAELRRRSLRVHHRKFRHYSFIGPIVNEYRSEIDIDAFRSVVDRLLRGARLNAIFAIELQALTNYPQRGLGRSFLINAHALAWSDDPSIDHDEIVKQMRASKALHSHLGAPTVVCTPRMTNDEGLERLASYMLKAPRAGKRRQRDPQNAGRFQLEGVSRVRSDLRLRLFEILSQLELTDLVHGVLDGKFIRSSWKQELVAWNEARARRLRMPLDRDYDVAKLWRAVRRRPGNGSRRFEPVRFYGPRPRPLPYEQLPRAKGKRLRPGTYRFWS